MKATLVSIMRNICQAWIREKGCFVCVNNIKKALEEYEIKKNFDRMKIRCLTLVE